MTTRRTLLAAASGAIASSAIVTAAPVTLPDHPDAELLAACAAFDELERAYLATDFASPDDTAEGIAADVERERIAGAQGPVVGADRRASGDNAGRARCPAPAALRYGMENC